MPTINNFLNDVKEKTGLSKLGNDVTGYRIPGVGEFKGPARLFRRGAPINGFTLQLFAPKTKLEIQMNGDYTVETLDASGKYALTSSGSLTTNTRDVVTV